MATLWVECGNLEIFYFGLKEIRKGHTLGGKSIPFPKKNRRKQSLQSHMTNSESCNSSLKPTADMDSNLGTA